MIMSYKFNIKIKMKKDYAFKKCDLTLEWLCQTLLCIYDWLDAYICIYLIANRQVHLKNS